MYGKWLALLDCPKYQLRRVFLVVEIKATDLNLVIKRNQLVGQLAKLREALVKNRQ